MSSDAAVESTDSMSGTVFTLSSLVAPSCKAVTCKLQSEDDIAAARLTEGNHRSPAAPKKGTPMKVPPAAPDPCAPNLELRAAESGGVGRQGAAATTRRREASAQIYGRRKKGPPRRRC